MKESFTQYLDYIKQMIPNIEAQLPVIDEVAKRFCDCIASGGVVHMYGSGHSAMGAQEMFPRYASFPGFHHIAELSTTFYQQVVGTNGIRQSMFIENVEGLAPRILQSFPIKPQDCFLLFTTSGTGNVVIDMAIEAKKRGNFVVGITSKENCAVGTSKHSSGKKLDDVSDILLDNCAALGEGVVFLEGCASPIGPTSTMGNTLLVNLIKVKCAEYLYAMGKLPPVITHAHYIGKERSDALFEEALMDYERRLQR